MQILEYTHSSCDDNTSRCTWSLSPQEMLINQELFQIFSTWWLLCEKEKKTLLGSKKKKKNYVRSNSSRSDLLFSLYALASLQI